MYVSIKNRSLKICLCVCVLCDWCRWVCLWFLCENFYFFLYLLRFSYDFLLSNFAVELVIGGFDFSTVVDFVGVAALDFLQFAKGKNRVAFFYNNTNYQLQVSNREKMIKTDRKKIPNKTMQICNWLCLPVRWRYRLCISHCICCRRSFFRLILLLFWTGRWRIFRWFSWFYW